MTPKHSSGTRIAQDDELPWKWTIRLRCGHSYRVKSTPDLLKPLICAEDFQLSVITLAERISDE